MKKLQASALYFALVMALLISLISGSFILYAHSVRQELLHWDRSDKVVDNCFSGIALGLNQDLKDYIPTELDLYHQFQDSVKLTSKPWGVYETLTSEAHTGKHEFSKSVWLGRSIDESFSLYLQDRSKPLALCGKTYIGGPVYLPKSGVKRAYIEGQNYQGEQLIYGAVKTSQRSLPKPDAERIQALHRNLLGQFASDSVLTYISNDSLNVPFYEKNLVVRASAGEEYCTGFFEGNVILHFPGKVTIANTAQLNGVQVFAREIVVQEGSTLQAQLFATEKIHIEANCNLKHPSAVGLLQPENKSVNLEIESGSRIEGITFLINEVEPIRHFSTLKIHPDVLLVGQVYTNQDLDLKGNIHGQLWCKRMLMKTPSSLYENHLLSVELDIHKLPSDFLTGNLINYSNHKSIILWLD
ncbi:polymer-forming cytoskeletal protein [bacterium SCSIO 12741]|nr:polymer-forming cytoskeletal protein [bacterium SCSIO 12741]